MKKFNQAWLPYLAQIAQALMFSYVGVSYFGLWGWLIGPAVGVVVSASLAVASSRISDISQKRILLARAMYGVLLLLIPATIALTSFAPKSMWAAIAWAAAPDIAIGLAGSIAGGSLIAKDDSATSKPKQNAKPMKPAKAEPEPAKEPEKPAFSCSCGATFGSQPALNAHQRKHKQVIGYNVSFEPVKQDEIAQGKL